MTAFSIVLIDDLSYGVTVSIRASVAGTRLHDPIRCAVAEQYEIGNISKRHEQVAVILEVRFIARLDGLPDRRSGVFIVEPDRW